MKRIQDIEKLTAADWDRIGADETVPVPSHWQLRLPRRRRTVVWSIAASVAVLSGIGLWGLKAATEPKDTFSDPYLAYAAVEQAFARMGGSVAQSAQILSEQQTQIDKISYWK